MSEPAPPSIRETVLRECLAADPNPWYPREYADKVGIDREGLYGPLNDLRVANLVQLTDWVKGKGQGYLITRLGREVLSDPAFLAQLRPGRPGSSAGRRPGGPSSSPGSPESSRPSSSPTSWRSPGRSRSPSARSAS